MLQIPFHIADSDDGSPYGPLIFIAIIVVFSLIGALSKAVGKSRQQRGQLPPGSESPGRPAGDEARPPSVDEFLEQIRKMAKGETGPFHPPEQPTGFQKPAARPTPPPPPRPVSPIRAAQRPVPPPPPPPRPLRAQPAAEQPRRPPPPPPRPAPPSPAPRRFERPPLTARAAEKTAEAAPPKATLESVSALTESAALLAAAAPKAPPRRRRERAAKKLPEKPEPAKPPRKAAPGTPSLGASPAELRAALRARLAAGPSALREAVLLGEVLGQPIGMRRRRAHRPGGPSRLI
jgi:hypothetical protein